MNVLKKAVLGVMLAVGSTTAMAALPTVPTQPVNVTTTGAPANGLFVAVWDLATNSSLVQYLGLNYTQFTPADLAAEGAFLDFGVLDKFVTTFSDAIATGRTNQLSYMVVTVPSSVLAFNVLATGAPGFSEELLVNGDPDGFKGSATGVRNWIGDVFNVTPVATDQCGRVNSCVVTNNGSDARNWGTNQTTSDNLGGSIPAGTSYAGQVGSALAMFLTNTSGGVITSSLVSGANTWLLTSAGQLTYGAPIPLPAAAWLLLSGLVGLGVVGRRREAA